MNKERYKVKVSDDLCFVGVFDLQENKYVVNESVICLDTAQLLCDMFNKVDKQAARIKELEKIRDKGNQKLENFYNEKINKLDNDYNRHFDRLRQENQQLKEQLSDEERAHDLCIDSFNEECEKLRNQIKFESEARKRFKQSQNQKAIEELEKVKEFILKNACNSDEITFANWVRENYIDNQIKEFASEK